MAFAKGTRAYWSHSLPSVYGAGSKLREAAIKALDPAAVPVTVISVENDKGTLVKVAPDSGRLHGAARTSLANGTIVLTHEELIEIAAE